MIEIKLELSQFADAAKRMGAAVDQVPFALSRALNDAAIHTRERLIHSTWPEHVKQRRSNFPGAVLRVERSNKIDLTVAIRDISDRGQGHLYQHAYGGTKVPRGQHLAIPLASWVKYTASGISKRMRPKAIVEDTPKRALRIIPNKGIFVGKGGRLHLRYSFKPTATIRADVPFEQDFRRYMIDKIDEQFPIRLGEAMRTRR